MQISIHDYENNRVILAEVPDYLADADRSSDDIALAILSALGLSEGSCEYMIGEFNIMVDVNTLNSGRGYGNNTGSLRDTTQDFKADALAALEELGELPTQPSTRMMSEWARDRKNS